jgi:hypothetical protein
MSVNRDKPERRTVLVASPARALILVATKNSVSVLHAPSVDLSQAPAPGAVSDPALAQRVEELRGDGIEPTGFAATVEGGVTVGGCYLGLGPPNGQAARAAIAQALAFARANG